MTLKGKIDKNKIKLAALQTHWYLLILKARSEGKLESWECLRVTKEKLY